LATYVIVHQKDQKNEENRKPTVPEEKVNLPQKHLVNGVAVSQICEENQLQPTLFYRWQHQFFEQGRQHLKKITTEKKPA